jgi:hypothetical protein
MPRKKALDCDFEEIPTCHCICPYCDAIVELPWYNAEEECWQCGKIMIIPQH